MKVIIAKKIGMTQLFDESGNHIPVTVLSMAKNMITGIKTNEKDGYNAVQTGSEAKKELNKPLAGLLKKNNISTKITKLTEYRTDNLEQINIGDDIILDDSDINKTVTVIGQGKGKGFQGTVKRHGFTIGPKSHGSKNKRKPGSIGSAYPQRVIKGRKMPGRMGGNKVTTKNLTIVDIDKQNNLIMIKGSVPGANRTYSIIKIQ